MLNTIASPERTLMFREAAESGDVVRRQRTTNAATLTALGGQLRDTPPRALVTLGRGSSDNAATFARYLVERRLGVLTGSAAPSVASVYETAPDMRDVLVLAISQSGRSPDLLTAVEKARDRGARIVALVNDETSPLAAQADTCLPLAAGPERSVAATKSFIATLSAILDFIAAWADDQKLAAALDSLPDLLDRAWNLDWAAAVPALKNAHDLYVVGRGHGFGIAQEAALKIKETCGFHAEAFSAAEIRHGPMSLVGNGFPVLLFGQQDATLDSVAELAREFAGRGAELMRAGVPGDTGISLPTIDTDPLIAPVAAILSFYRMANALAVARGHDPDHPPHLAKVTETV
ncbi:SIS domain-containing protein [Stakelama sediminis]|uniref:Glucosamine--fructose-6-phosphate aminotransferase (Isomerizing) n=1 Tax=Stakelama sediminis TaxID=463200 RepID=A0A840YY30_9SPHN|nr:glucosamine--fructose-6-phosphate aminotransferase (isomerizing) [Stakelama sediminis]